MRVGRPYLVVPQGLEQVSDRREIPVQRQRGLPEILSFYLLKLKTKGNGPDSMAKNTRELQRFLDFAAELGVSFAGQIDEFLLIRYADTWLEAYPSSLTRGQVRHRLSLFLTFCHRLGDLLIIPEIPAVRQKRQPTLPLTPEQYGRLLEESTVYRPKANRDHIPRPVRRAVILLMRWAGPSITDATMMLRTSIYFDHERGIYRCEYRRQKTGVLVNNPLPQEIAEEILAAARLCSGPTHLFQEAGTEGLGRGSKRRWVDWFDKAFARAGMPKGHSHQLRDTFAVELLLQRVPLEAVSRALGHTSVKTTEKYYSPWIKERQDLLDDTILQSIQGQQSRQKGATLPPKKPPERVPKEIIATRSLFS